MSSHVKEYVHKRVIKVINCVGVVLIVWYVLQIGSGFIISSIGYICFTGLSLVSVVEMSVEVCNGYVVRGIHCMGCSLIMLSMKIHIVKLIKERIYRYNMSSYYSGFVIYVLTMGIGFLGYCIVWGQMSYWGGTVITSLLILDVLKKIIVGGNVCGSSMLGRFYSLHFVLPLIGGVLIGFHIIYLHKRGSTKI